MNRLKIQLSIIFFGLIIAFCFSGYQWLIYEQSLHENPSSNIHHQSIELTEDKKQLQRLFDSIHYNWQNLSTFFGYATLLFAILLSVSGSALWKVLREKQ